MKNKLYRLWLCLLAERYSFNMRIQLAERKYIYLWKLQFHYNFYFDSVMRDVFKCIASLSIRPLRENPLSWLTNASRYLSVRRMVNAKQSVLSRDEVCLRRTNIAWIVPQELTRSFTEKLWMKCIGDNWEIMHSVKAGTMARSIMCDGPPTWRSFFDMEHEASLCSHHLFAKDKWFVPQNDSETNQP